MCYCENCNEEKEVIALEFNLINQYGNQTTLSKFEEVMVGDGLPQILDNFKNFLNSVGYSVDEVIAIFESGGETSSEY